MHVYVIQVYMRVSFCEDMHGTAILCTVTGCQPPTVSPTNQQP